MTQLQYAQTDTLRHAELGDLANLLKAQADVKYDVVTSLSALDYRDGNLVVKDGAAKITDDGVESTDAVLRPTRTAEDQLGYRFDIPAKYLRKLRDSGLRVPSDYFVQPDGTVAENPLLLDDTVRSHFAAEPDRKVLLRAWKTDDTDAEGVLRAVLSDRYAIVDNYDVLLAGLAGVKEAGVDVQIDGVDLSENRMRVRIVAPEVQALAPVLLENYRSPFGGGGIERVREIAAHEGLGYAAGNEPVVFAGFELSNSETGGGAFQIVPRLVVQVCRNGMTIQSQALREIHLGGRLDEGIINWSADTQRRSLELITAKATDAVRTFLDGDWLANQLRAIESKAGARITAPQATIERVAKQFSFSDTEQEAVLGAFIASGQLTAGGVLNAVTAAAQTVADPDRAAELEASALAVLEAAYAAA